MHLTASVHIEDLQISLIRSRPHPPPLFTPPHPLACAPCASADALPSSRTRHLRGLLVYRSTTPSPAPAPLPSPPGLLKRPTLPPNDQNPATNHGRSGEGVQRSEGRGRGAAKRRSRDKGEQAERAREIQTDSSGTCCLPRGAEVVRRGLRGLGSRGAGVGRRLRRWGLGLWRCEIALAVGRGASKSDGLGTSRLCDLHEHPDPNGAESSLFE